jgi:hypothetical protein
LVGVTPVSETAVPFASAPELGLSFFVPPGTVIINTFPELAAQLEQDVPRTTPGGLPAADPIVSLPLVLVIVPPPPRTLGVSAMRKVTVSFPVDGLFEVTLRIVAVPS